jgi:hypothetical protein
VGSAVAGNLAKALAQAVELRPDPLQALLRLLKLGMRKSRALAARHPAGDADQNRTEPVGEIGREPYPLIGAGVPIHMHHDAGQRPRGGRAYNMSAHIWFGCRHRGGSCLFKAVTGCLVSLAMRVLTWVKNARPTEVKSPHW